MKCIYGKNPKVSYFMTEALIVQKEAYKFASYCKGEWFSVLRKSSYKLEKKWKNFRKYFSLPYLLEKIQSENHFDITFSLKRSLLKPRKINETMNPIFGFGHEIYELKQKRTKNFFLKKMKSFGRETKGPYLTTVTLLIQKIAYICAVLLERERFLYLLSGLRNMSNLGKNFSEKFLSFFLPKNTKYEKKFDVIFRPKCSL